MMAKIFLLLAGAIFVGVGAYNLALPVDAISIFEIELRHVSSLNEIRANYGGMHLLLGLFFLYGAHAQHFRLPALLFVAVFTGGLVLGRVVSLALDGSPNPFVWAFLALEAVGCLAGVLLFLKGKAEGGNVT